MRLAYAAAVAAVAASMLLAACGSPAASSPAVGRVTLEVSGGIAGLDRMVTVEPDGAVTVQDMRATAGTPVAKRMARADLQRLHALIRDPAFAALGPAYLPETQGADEQDYVLTASLGSSVVTTMTRDGATAPPILRQVLELLNPLFAA
jgi:hypothetical protein